MSGSIFSIFDIGVRGLYAHKTALNVTGQNIANANTENYVRQRADLRESEPVDGAPGQLGTGVKVQEIIRIKDEFTDFQLRNQNSTYGYLDTKNDIYQQLENIFNEPSDNGLNSMIASFYGSLNTLQENPHSRTARSMVVSQAEALSSMFNDTNEKLSELQANLDQNVTYNVAEINEVTDEIATLNDQILKAEVGGNQNANDLRNRRDALINGDLFVNEDDNGQLQVQLGDQMLVTGVYSTELATQNSSNNTLDIVTKTGQRLVVRNGSLKGLLDMRDDVIKRYGDDINDLAKSMIKEINDVHIAGVGLTDPTDTNVRLFQNVTSENDVSSVTAFLTNAGLDFDVSGGAFSISLYDGNGSLKSENSITINPFSQTLTDVANSINAIAGISSSVTSDNRLSISVTNASDQFSFISDSASAGDTSGFLTAIGLNTFFKGSDASSIAVASTIANDPNKIAAGKSLSPHDNTNVLEIIGTRDQVTTDGATFENYYSSMIGDLGVERQENTSRQETQELILKTLEERQQAESGVSFDEEAVNLLKYQRGYQACAKFINVMDGLIETLIGIV